MSDLKQNRFFDELVSAYKSQGDEPSNVIEQRSSEISDSDSPIIYNDELSLLNTQDNNNIPIDEPSASEQVDVALQDFLMDSSSASDSFDWTDQQQASDFSSGADWTTYDTDGSKAQTDPDVDWRIDENVKINPDDQGDLINIVGEKSDKTFRHAIGHGDFQSTNAQAIPDVPVVEEFANNVDTDLVFSSLSINEGVRSGASVGTVRVADPGLFENPTYEVIDPTGTFVYGKNKGSGAVKLAAGATLDFEDIDTYDVIVSVSDANGLTYSEAITINVNDVNEAPTGSGAARVEGSEDLESGSLLTAVSVSDPDAGDILSFDILGGSDLFEMIGNEVHLKSGVSLDYETDASHLITVRATDTSGLSFDTTVTIDITDVVGESINGTISADILTGTDEQDTISGNAGDDTVYGAAGDDLIMGSTGNDSLHGGDGSDTFIFAEGEGNDAVYGGSGVNWVDVIHLQDSMGGNDIGDFGSDWTLALSEGTATVNDDNIELSHDADGIITMKDGSTLEFENVESIVW